MEPFTIWTHFFFFRMPIPVAIAYQSVIWPENFVIVSDGEICARFTDTPLGRRLLDMDDAIEFNYPQRRD